MLSTDGAYTVLARVLDLRPLSTVSTSHREVGLLVDAPARLVPTLTRQLERTQGHASFAVEGAIPSSTRTDAFRAGDETIPRLRGARALSWLTTKQRLRRSASRLGLSGHFLYAVPHDGFTMGQYLLAYAAGARPVSGAIRYGAGGSLTGLRAGDVVEVSLRPGDASWTRALASVVARCRRAGLQPVAVSALMAGRSSHARGASAGRP
jgi:hypothetical protein